MKKLSTDQITYIKDLIRNDCTLTLRELKAEIYDHYNLSVSLTTISNYINGFNFSLKRVDRIAERAECQN
jgi:transposase